MIHLLLAIIYLSFISLGLPDAMLGAAWPVMHTAFGIPISYAGILSVTVAIGTIVSSLLSDLLTRQFGAGRVTAFSVGMTALALLGFSWSHGFWMLWLFAIPYGLGAGGVDAALNNYVAVHYASRHMSWLHCMWGVGASTGPYIMSLVLSHGMTWNTGYRIIALAQVILSIGLFLSVPLWKHRHVDTPQPEGKPLTLKQIFALPGAKEITVAFFCYCAVEQTVILWGSSYLVLKDGLDKDTAAGLAGLFLLGMTLGRAVSGFLTYRIPDTGMIRLGQIIVVLGIAVMVLPLGQRASMAGLLLIGLGCAPIYPSIIHSTPAHFGEENSQALVGIQMASAYLGALAAPPLFGLIADHITVSLLPWYLTVVGGMMILMSETLNRKTRA